MHYNLKLNVPPYFLFRLSKLSKSYWKAYWQGKRSDGPIAPKSAKVSTESKASNSKFSPLSAPKSNWPPGEAPLLTHLSIWKMLEKKDPSAFNWPRDIVEENKSGEMNVEVNIEKAPHMLSKANWRKKEVRSQFLKEASPSSATSSDDDFVDSQKKEKKSS